MKGGTMRTLLICLGLILVGTTGWVRAQAYQQDAAYDSLDYGEDFVSGNLDRQVSVMRHRQAILREEIRKNRGRISQLEQEIQALRETINEVDPGPTPPVQVYEPLEEEVDDFWPDTLTGWLILALVGLIVIGIVLWLIRLITRNT